jgi:MFS family permease
MSDTGALLRQRPVSLLLATEGLGSIASAAVATALGWQVLERWHNPLAIGLLGLSEFIPALLLTLPAGHASDHHDRRIVAALGMFGLAAVSLLLAIDAAAGDTRAWPLFVLALGGGAAQAFVSPTLNPLLAAAVPAASLARAVAMSSSTWQSATIIGPALAGLLQSAGNPVPYVASLVCCLGGGVLVLLLPRAVGTAHVMDVDEPSFGDALAGVRLILAARPLLGAISLDLVAVLFGGATALLPLVARDVLHVGSTGYGILRAAPGVGAVVVALLLSVKPLRRHVGSAMFVAVGLFGVFTVVFGLSRTFVLSLVALALLAAADMVSVFIRGTLAPLLTPPALRGRVGAVERLFVGASNELGAFESGLAAALIGVVPAIVVGGCISLAVAGLWAWRFPELRGVDRFEDVQPVAA